MKNETENKNTDANVTPVKDIKKTKEQIKKDKEAENFKKKYFEYYDDVKTNIREDW